MPHTHGHNARHQAKRGEHEQTNTEANMEVQEEQPTTEMEVTTVNTQENQPEVNQTERPVATEETKLDNLMRMMMEKFGEMKESTKTLKADLKEDNQKLCQQMTENNK